jgi:thioredoxin-dependent peroxiredoxin
MAIERTGEAFELGERLTVIGPKLQLGDVAPDFTLETFDPGDQTLQTARLGDSDGKVRLMSVVNSVDTPVCHIETRRWDRLRDDLPPDVAVYTVSMDLPFAQARWRSGEDAGHALLSAHKDETFGRDYGVLIKEWRLLQRAVFVIDRQNRIVHAEYVADQMTEPDYDSAVTAARQAAAGA